MLCADTLKALSHEFAVTAQQRAAELLFSCLSRNALAVLAYLEASGEWEMRDTGESLFATLWPPLTVTSRHVTQ